MNLSASFRHIDVTRNIEAYFASEDGDERARNPDDRFASFDYCFNYFQTFRDEGRIDELCQAKNLQQSCLQLGFYLASWGMLRGNTYLLKKSIRFYQGVVQTLATLDRRLWDIDVNTYSDENIGLLLDAAAVIRRSLSTRVWSSDTLVTKIMLGVFGNVPAFDTYFGKALGVWTLNRASLKKIADFYFSHESVIDRCAASIRTLDFYTGKDTARCYTKAKVVDMVGFMQR